MRQHNGMRPQDIPILLKILSKGEASWKNKELAAELFISPAEVTESLNRSEMAGLVGGEKRKRVHRQSLMEFLQYGLHYVFPAAPGSQAKGLYTAHSHPFMRQYFSSDQQFVWAESRGESLGISIEPLYKNQAQAAKLDDTLYLMLALIDVIRVGKAREITVATEELKKLIL